LSGAPGSAPAEDAPAEAPARPGVALRGQLITDAAPPADPGNDAAIGELRLDAGQAVTDRSPQGGVVGPDGLRHMLAGGAVDVPAPAAPLHRAAPGNREGSAGLDTVDHSSGAPVLADAGAGEGPAVSAPGRDGAGPATAEDEGTVLAGPGTAPDAAVPEPPAERRQLSATLTGLRIAGFKSFAEPVQVPVLPGLTGIVGPNGCGKSNVVEALRWAMGESSARSLRGGEMDDVIFSGTATRPARNLGEVVLKLEEAEGVAPAPHHQADEIEVSRRIERGAGSAYRINGREVRARDVQTMFADLASGPRASGMVSQGRVAALIGAKPEERRSVLEEAAGISGLRARRHEAELKLRQAEANLSRSEDLLAQLALQADSLRKQARQAARYRNLSGLVREAEGEWFALLVARAEGALDEARAALAGREDALREAERAAEAAARDAESTEAALHAPRAEEGLARTLLERRRVEAENAAAEAGRAAAALAEAEAALAQLRADGADAARLEADARAAMGRARREEAGLAGVEAELPARLATAEAEAASRAAEVGAAEARTEEATEAAAALAARANGLAAELSFAEGRSRRLAEQQALLAASQARADAEAVPDAALAAAEAALAEAETALSARRAAADAAERARAEAVENAAEAARAARAAEAERGAAERARTAAAARLQPLRAREAALLAERLPAIEPATEAEASAAAAAEALAVAEAALREAAAARAEAAREARTAREAEAEAQAAAARLRAEWQGLRAAAAPAGEAEPIIGALRVPEGLEPALGAALGEGLEGGRGAGQRFWRVLPPLDEAPPLPRGAQPLDAMVGAPPELSRALGQIGLVDDGAPLQAALRPGQALVSRGGALWRWDGFVLAEGAGLAGAARLQTLARQRQAEAQLAEAQPRAEAAETARAQAQAAERAAQAAEDAARAARDRAEQARRHAAHRAAEAAARHDAATRRHAEHAAQAGRLAAERAEAEAALRDAEAALAAAPTAISAAAEQQAAQQAQAAEQAARHARAEAESRLAARRAEQAALRSRHAAAEAQRAALAPQRERLDAETGEAEAALRRARAERAALPDLAAARAAVDAARLDLAGFRGRDAEARGLLAALRAERDGLAQRRAAAEAEREAWTGRLADAASRLRALDGRIAEAAARRDALARAPEEVSARAEAAARQTAGAEASHQAARAALDAAERHARAAAETRRAAEAALGAARESRLLAEAASERATEAGQALAQRILERLGDDATLPEPSADLSDAAEERARRRVERLGREREEMGPVNLRAEVELGELDTRIAGIHVDRDEIAAAISKLRGSIGHLNREARERLRSVFEQVDREFQSLFGTLFGGGRAHLALVGSDDPLEAGLEIYAEPPGKKLSSLALLSGGEQALTALSLVFAVFRCHPAPVCVLDEVDAPLDDANVERLCDLLDRMSETGTRFLIVTHHALTMARMHRLFGVTMQERGVSRLLSVDLGEAVRMAEG
jgi:chromosome segregation protein